MTAMVLPIQPNTTAGLGRLCCPAWSTCSGCDATKRDKAAAVMSQVSSGPACTSTAPNSKSHVTVGGAMLASRSAAHTPIIWLNSTACASQLGPPSNDISAAAPEVTESATQDAPPTRNVLVELVDVKLVVEDVKAVGLAEGRSLGASDGRVNGVMVGRPWAGRQLGRRVNCSHSGATLLLRSLVTNSSQHSSIVGRWLNPVQCGCSRHFTLHSAVPPSPKIFLPILSNHLPRSPVVGGSK